MQNTASARPAGNNGGRARKQKKQKDPNRIRFIDLLGRVDIPMLVITLVLLTFGITMMFSAGHALSYRENDGNSYAFATKQMQAAGLGLIMMFLASMFDYRLLRHEFRLFHGKYKFTLATLIFIITLVMTAMCIPFGVSNIEDGPRRWLKVPIFGTFQPSDFLKVGLIMFLAYYIHKNYDQMRRIKVGVIRPMIPVGIICFLMYKQPHLSGLIIMLGISVAMLFVGGMNWKPFIPFVIAFGAILVVMFLTSDFTYFGDRFKYMDPLSDPMDKSYQSYQAALAVGSGGMWGVGFGNSSQKYYYLPEAQNDFVYAVLCEEFGFVGGLFVIILFIVFVLRGFYIARQAEDKFGMLLATGISLQVGIQALLNIGVNVFVIPNTGVSLPFFSYGGTALLVQLVEVGLLLSVSKRAKLN